MNCKYLHSGIKSSGWLSLATLLRPGNGVPIDIHEYAQFLGYYAVLDAYVMVIGNCVLACNNLNVFVHTHSTNFYIL